MADYGSQDKDPATLDVKIQVLKRKLEVRSCLPLQYVGKELITSNGFQELKSHEQKQ